MAAAETSHLASRAVDELYREHRAEIYRYAYAVLGNHADAEDVTQTTFLNAYRALEQGVRLRKPLNWLLTIASNAIKQQFRQKQTRPKQVEFVEGTSDSGADEDGGPSVGELLVALWKIPPQQRQAIVLREFEGRSYAEIALILGVTTSALETLLFRARRSLAEELEEQLTCMDAQFAISKALDGRMGRKERRRLRDHLAECPDCAHFARVQPRHRSALRGLMFIPIPLSLSLFKSLEDAGTATAAMIPVAAGEGAGAAGTSSGMTSGLGTAGGAGGSAVAGGVTLKAAAVVAAVTITGGMAVTGAVEFGKTRAGTTIAASNEGQSLAGRTARPGRPHGHVPAPDRVRRSANVPATARRVPQTPASPHFSAEPDAPGLNPEIDDVGTETAHTPQRTQPGPHTSEPQGNPPPGSVPPPESQPNQPQPNQPQPNQPQGTQPPGTQQPVLAQPSGPSQGQASKKPSKAKQPKAKQPKAKRPKAKQPARPDKPKPEKSPKAEHQPKLAQEPKPEPPKAGTKPNESSASSSKPANDNAGRPKH
jgi:RNA polymerase sigma factor (sigma-70 family)